MNEDQGPTKPPTIDLDAIYRKMDDDWHRAMMDELARLPPGHIKGGVPAEPALGCEMTVIEDRDKRRAAYHEAGHVVVAVSLGCQRVTAELGENENGGPEELHWIGRTGYRDGSASEDVEAAIGWAGQAAELILTNDEFAEWWDDQIEEMSASDRSLVEHREDWSHDCTLAVDTLKRQWDYVERIADALMQHHALTDWDISQLLKPA
jgi:hypothetical protein